MSVSASPRSDAIVFDLLGDLYIVDGSGGKARRITSGSEWDIEPRFSPDGSQIAFISDRDGTDNIWLVEPDGTGLAQVSRERFEGLGSPGWSVDGQKIYARKKIARRSITYKDVWVINEYEVEDGTRRSIVDEGMSLAIQHSSRVQLLGLTPTGPVGGADGSSVYFAGQTGEARLRDRSYVEYQIMRLDLASGDMASITSAAGGAFRPEISPDGRFIAFGRREAELTNLWLRDLESGDERRLLEGITHDDYGNRAVNDLIPAFSWTGDSESIVIARNGGIVRVNADSGDITKVPFDADVELQLAPMIAPTRIAEQGSVKARILRWHRLSPDGNRLAFQGLGKVWLMDLPDGKPTPLNGVGVTASAYDTDELFEFAPAWSPDGAVIAYAVSGKDGNGHIHVTDLSSGSARQLTTQPGEYSNITYSSDGLALAYTVALPRQHTYDPSIAEIRTVNLESGEETTVTTMVSPGYRSALPNSGFPAPVFSSDNARIFYIEQTGQSENQFVSVNREGDDKRIYFKLDWLSEAVPSPDDRRVAVVVHDSIYTMDLSSLDTGDETLTTTDLGSIQRVSSAGASVSWVDDDTIAWGYGDRYYRSTISVDAEVGEIHVDLQAPRDRPEGLVAFTGAKIISMSDPNGGVIDVGDILIEDNRIVQIGKSGSFQIPDAAFRIDGTGTTILPGFVDLHAHPIAAKPSGLIEQQVRGLQGNLAYGVTTIHEPANDIWYTLGAAELIETGQILGPRLYSSGDQVIGFWGPHNEWIDSLETARIVVGRRQQLGAMSIKEYGQPSRIQRQWLAQAAREHGMRIITEGTGGFHLPLTDAVDGFTGIEHSIAQVPLSLDAIELLAFSQVAYDPVLVYPRRGSGAGRYFSEKAQPLEDDKRLRYTDKELIIGREKRRAGTVVAPYDYVFIEQGREAHKIADAGGRVVTGSHGPGAALHFDIWAYVVAGMSPLEALHTATLSGIKALGLESDLGTLEAGKLADFVVLNADPLDDIQNTRDIRLVVRNGRVYDDELLNQVWPDKKEKPFSNWPRQ